MKDQNLDLFDPRTAVMDPEYSPSSTRDPDFGFAFNDVNFSDRLLQIEIMADSFDPQSDSDSFHSQSLADWARNRKRRREDIRKEMGLSLYSFFSLS